MSAEEKDVPALLRDRIRSLESGFIAAAINNRDRLFLSAPMLTIIDEVETQLEHDVKRVYRNARRREQTALRKNQPR